ncbi:MAG: glycosyltransferase family 4 protein, partial [Nanoarchaeota archaeon]
MKIAHVSPEYYPAIGGVGQVVRELAERQAKAGHEVHVFAPDWDKKNRIRKREEIMGEVHIHRCYHLSKIANFNTFWPSVLFRLIKLNFDIIHSHNFGHIHSFLSAIASLVSKAKHIHTTHCPWSDAQRSLAGRIGILISYNFFSRLVLSTASAIIAITPWEIDFIKRYSGRADKIIVIPNGMSSNFFVKIKNNNFKKLNKLKKHVVLFFSRLNKTKSPDHF